MSNIHDDIESQIINIIHDHTAFMRHYEAQVVDNLDTLKKGRVKVVIPELGFDTPDLGMWCFARQGEGMSVPPIGSWVEVYFLKGDGNQPRYLSYASEMKGMVPDSFDGKPTTHVIWENKTSGDNIVFDEILGTLTLNFTSGKIENIILKTGDATAWKPNTMNIDPYTGAPHSVGILLLKGA